MPALTTVAAEVAEAYDAFAPVYDRFTAGHDYEAWLTNLERLALNARLVGKRVLDIACGTGKSFEPLLRRGYEITGVDVSAGMLEHAAAKHPEVRLIRCDMRELAVIGRFDLVTCLDDALNYLEDPADMLAAFRAAATNLRAGGLYVFDLNTLSTYRGFFATTTSLETDGLLGVHRGLGSPDASPGCGVDAVLELFEAQSDGSWRRHTSRHRQRHHPTSLITGLLERAGFARLGVYGLLPSGNLDPHPDEEVHHKLMVLARKERD